MTVVMRDELPGDVDAIAAVTTTAFAKAPHYNVFLHKPYDPHALVSQERTLISQYAPVADAPDR